MLVQSLQRKLWGHRGKWLPLVVPERPHADFLLEPLPLLLLTLRLQWPIWAVCLGLLCPGLPWGMWQASCCGNGLPYSVPKLNPTHMQATAGTQPPGGAATWLTFAHTGTPLSQQTSHGKHNFKEKIIKNSKMEIAMHLDNHGDILSTGPCVTVQGTYQWKWPCH